MHSGCMGVVMHNDGGVAVASLDARDQVVGNDFLLEDQDDIDEDDERVVEFKARHQVRFRGWGSGESLWRHGKDAWGTLPH